MLKGVHMQLGGLFAPAWSNYYVRAILQT